MSDSSEYERGKRDAAELMHAELYAWKAKFEKQEHDLAAAQARIHEYEYIVQHCAVCNHHLLVNADGVPQCRCCEAEAAAQYLRIVLTNMTQDEQMKRVYARWPWLNPEEDR